MSRDKTAEERAPMCPICNHRHWNREPHIWKPQASKKAAKRKTSKRKRGKKR